MRIYRSFPILLFLCAAPLWAQLNFLPPSSGTDGIYLRPYVTSQETGWSSSGLSSYRMSADNAFSTPSDGAWDSFGQKWTSLAPDRTTIATGGGTLRGILLGESGSAFEAMGYSYTGTPAAADSFTLSYSVSGYAPAFGDRADLPLSPGDATAFDLWVCTPFGVYTVFAPGNSTSVSGVSAQVLWTEAPLLVPTFIPALNNTALVETWIVSVIEQGGPTEARSEFRFAFQQFPVSGHSNGGAPVPEPSSYVLLGTALCGILIIRRRFRRK